ncbi:MAG: Stp1/IreP family PP2C-type Ser/Thr phosphatase [Burkholderiales bacterium]|nr:Stp1/IreP family PP2C-type Ser/Thr phosphatase [Burkholderiales bacterium]
MSAEQTCPQPAFVPAVEIVGVTDVGRLRSRNEDAIDWDTRLGLAMVADGMGGSQGGDVASATALRSIKDDLRRALADSRRHGERAYTKEVRGSLVVELVRRANQGVRKSASRDNRLSGMGTTLVMALVGPDFLTAAHVGDSRMYLLRDRSFIRLTDDHSMVQELVERGAINARQAAKSRHRNVITRALGIAQDVAVDVQHHAIRAGDIFMLCTDGLTNMASDAEIGAVVDAHGHDLQAAARNAVRLANARGGRDNVSVVLIRILGGPHG